MGDLIQLTPLLAALAERWGAPCDLVAAAGAAPRRVLAHLSFVGEIETLRSRRTPFPLSREQRRLTAWLRRRPRGPVYAVEELPKVFRLLAWGGVDPAQTLSMRELPRGDLEHAVDYFHRLGDEVPLAYREAPPRPVECHGPPRLEVTSEELEDCRSWLGRRGWAGEPLVVLQALTRRRKRGRWPEDRWRALVAAVLADLPEARILLVGSPSEAGDVARLAAAIGDRRVEVAASDLPLRRLFALLALAHSCVSLDTGPAHAAATLGCPLVVVVGMADPRRNHPLAPPGNVLMATAVAEEEGWPPSRAEWEVWHEAAAVPTAPVIAAWRTLPPRATLLRPAFTADGRGPG
ncbi:MAG TPA: glycosyltransferase family 9 protein [Thermoanaerobaculia bacterium]|nr:glycosyltransferase family 9 protein [Thermoanaerobaculia bacterium]